MIEFKESKFYKLLQDFFINNNKETFLQMLAEFYNRTEGIIDKNKNQDELIKELRELYIEFNEKGIDENIVIEKVNHFVENNVKIKDILAKLVINTNKIEDNTEKLNANTNSIENINSQLDTIETKLLNPEMFRFQDGIEVDDQTAINTALNVAFNSSNELHFYQDYSIDQLIIDKNIICYFHDIKLTNKTGQDVFIEINNQAKVCFKGKLTVISDKCNIGILNNDSALNIDYLIISKSKKVNVEYRKVNVGGYGEITYLESKLSKVGLYLNTTDTKVNRYQGFCCLTHILNKGGGNFISNAHGWGVNDTTYGDWVTNSTMLKIEGGSCVINNLYADTTENAIMLPNGNEYTLIDVTNLVYFLNRTYYPDGINRPTLLKNLSNFTGKLSIANVQADNSAWRNSEGNQVYLIDDEIDYNRIHIEGIKVNGYLWTNNFIIPTKGEMYNYISNETSNCFSMFRRRYYAHNDEKRIILQGSMSSTALNDAEIYSCTFLPPFDTITFMSNITAWVETSTMRIPMATLYNDNTNVLKVMNKSGANIDNGALTIIIEHFNYL